MIAKNLKLIRNKLQLSQSEFANSLGMQQAQYSTYERGSRKPSAEVFEKLAIQYKVNINFLLTGLGSMFITPESQKELIHFKIPKNSRVLLEVED